MSDAQAEPFWQVARRPRMLGLLAVLLLAAAVCTRLGIWQLDRAQVHGAQAEQRRVAALVTADPVPLAQVLAPQTSFTGGLVGRKVEVTGTYEPDDQLLVTGRVHAGVVGSLVLTPLRVDVDGEQAVLPVVRGWVPGTQGEAAPPPTGPVHLVGYLQAGEAPAGTITDGRTEAISPGQLLTAWSGPIWTGYLVLAESDPGQSGGLALLDVPTRTGAGLNLQNLAYAAQWWIFAAFALVVWWRAVRDESRDGVGEGTDSPVGPSEPDGPAGPAEQAGPAGQ